MDSTAFTITFTFPPHPAQGNSMFMEIIAVNELFTIGAMSARVFSRNGRAEARGLSARENGHSACKYAPSLFHVFLIHLPLGRSSTPTTRYGPSAIFPNSSSGAMAYVYVSSAP